MPCRGGAISPLVTRGLFARHQVSVVFPRHSAIAWWRRKVLDRQEQQLITVYQNCNFVFGLFILTIRLLRENILDLLLVIFPSQLTCWLYKLANRSSLLLLFQINLSQPCSLFSGGFDKLHDVSSFYSQIPVSFLDLLPCPDPFLYSSIGLHSLDHNPTTLNSSSTVSSSLRRWTTSVVFMSLFYGNGKRVNSVSDHCC